MFGSKIHQREWARIVSDPAIPDDAAEWILRESLEDGENNWMVWSAAVSRPNIPVHYFDALLERREFTVLLSIAHSGRTEDTALEKLATLPKDPTSNLKDRWKEVRDVAREQLQRRHR